MIRAAVVFAVLLSAGFARAGDTVQVLPGAARAIPHSMSASRDTAVLGYQLTPYSALMAGAEPALVGFFLRDVSLRVGYFGFLELESNTPYDPEGKALGPLLPFENIHFWRGQQGTQLSLAFDEGARRWLGERGMLEVTIGFRHESEHFTASTRGTEPRYGDVPHIGDFTFHDFAARIAVGDFDIELRLQNKLFLAYDTGQANGLERAYTMGPGFDAIVRWRLTDWIHPFSSTFGEYLIGNDFVWEGRWIQVPDAYLLRNLTGVIFPGKIGDIQLFSSLAVGHGKGLMVFREELLWGGGVRLAFF
jgi:hypothetical protein